MHGESKSRRVRIRFPGVVRSPSPLSARSSTWPTSWNASSSTRALPVMTINPAVKDIFSFRYEDFTLENYDPHPHIKAAVAV